MDFSNTEIAYKHLSNFELRRAYLLFKTIQIEPLTLFGSQMLRGFIKVGLPVGWAIKPTIFKHFVGGETIRDCETLVDKQFKENVATILDFSVEGQKNEVSFDQALQHFKTTVDYIAEKITRFPFAVFKPTALGSSRLIQMAQKKDRLTDSENDRLVQFRNRVTELCEYAVSRNVPVLVDAEESWIQEYIDELILDLQRRLNKNKAFIYNTMQLYRKDKLGQLQVEIKKAREEGFFYGVKIVRGAYMEKERDYAKDHGLKSPIFEFKKETDDSYNKAIVSVLENIDVVACVIGTHNKESCLKALTLMDELKIEKSDPRIYFSQLLGMADHISYNMAASKYCVAKYVPYGPVNEVLPYLFRRAEENSSVQGQAPFECSLLQKELHRRKGSGN